MKIRVMRFLMALILLLSNMVPGIYALEDVNPNGYVEDLSTLPTPAKPSSVQQQSVAHTVSAHYEMLYAAGLTVAGFIFLYIVNRTVRNKVNAYLGWHAEQSDEVHS